METGPEWPGHSQGHSGPAAISDAYALATYPGPPAPVRSSSGAAPPTPSAASLPRIAAYAAEPNWRHSSIATMPAVASAKAPGPNSQASAANAK